MHFWKMEATGNDFIVIMDEENVEYSKLALDICNRHFGVGGDGLLVMGLNPLSMRVYNADGSIALMCGNGLRCISYLYNALYDKKLDNFEIVTDSGIKNITRDRTLYCVELGECIRTGLVEVSVSGVSYCVHLFDFGAKHAVLSGDKYSEDIIMSISQQLDCNVNIVEFVSNNQIKCKTFERGVGWTQSCGSGACACYAFLDNYYSLDESVIVYQNGGEVLVSRDEDGFSLCGGACLVFEGEWIWNV